MSRVQGHLERRTGISVANLWRKPRITKRPTLPGARKPNDKSPLCCTHAGGAQCSQPECDNQANLNPESLHDYPHKNSFSAARVARQLEFVDDRPGGGANIYT